MFISLRPSLEHRSSGHFAGAYEPRRDQLASTLDLQKFFRQVGWWISLRPPVIPHDADHRMMFGKNVPGEIAEAEFEAHKLAAKRTSATELALATEWTDIAFFLGAYVNASQIHFDSTEVRRGVNGHGRGSNIYEKLTETAGNISEQRPEKGITELLKIWVAGLAGLPVEYRATESQRLVLEKNSRNYPAEFFSGRDPQTGSPLNAEELEMQFTHSRRCLKFIRNHLRDTLGLKDRDYGLHESDYAHYRQHIHNFRHSDWAFAQLNKEYLSDPQIASLKNSVKLQ